MFGLNPIKFAVVNRNDPSYAEQTTEFERVDMWDLPHLHNVVYHTHIWVERVVYRGLLSVDTSHWRRRMQQYLQRPTRDGQYPELMPNEFNTLQNINLWLAKTHPPFNVVEVGWNRFGSVCKVSVLLRIPCSGRYLFLCIGMDRGIKTFYINTHPKVPKAHSLLRYKQRSSPPRVPLNIRSSTYRSSTRTSLSLNFHRSQSRSPPRFTSAGQPYTTR